MVFRNKCRHDDTVAHKKKDECNDDEIKWPERANLGKHISHFTSFLRNRTLC